jgi:hypothetical protein
MITLLLAFQGIWLGDGSGFVQPEQWRITGQSPALAISDFVSDGALKAAS